MLHMFQWLYTHVASVYSKYSICFRRMLQVFLSRCCICCGCYTHMMQEYVANISPVSDVCCRSASCCNISRRSKRTHAKAAHAGAVVPTCVASEAGVGGPHLHAHHAHNYMRRRTNLQGQVCRLSSCMRHAGWTCKRSNCMLGRLSSKRGRWDGRSKRRGRGHPNVQAVGTPVHKACMAR